MNIKTESLSNTVETSKITSKRKRKSCRVDAHLYSRIKKSAVKTGFKEWSCIYCGRIIESS